MPDFRLRQLGRSGLEVSPICLGGNVFGWTVDESMSFRLLDAWVDAGMNFVDTADVYSRWVPGHVGGESETILGKWFRQSGKRNRVVLATKVGKPMGDNDKGLSKAYIRRAVEASLRRLKTEVIDLYQSHDDDAATPLEETLTTFADLIKEGKVRAIGASNYTGPRLALALETSRRLGVPRYESLQPLYNLVEREPVRERARAGLPRARRRRHQLLRAGERLPDRQVPQPGRPRQERSRQRRRQVPERARPRESSARSTRSRRPSARRRRRSRSPGRSRAPASPRRSPARPARRSSPASSTPPR
jgi:aryl-alcohol dehydrogenase-like predicted oxidoreductase